MKKIVYSIKEAAEALGVAEITIHRKVKNKEIPSRKMGSRVLIPAEFIEGFQFYEEEK